MKLGKLKYKKATLFVLMIALCFLFSAIATTALAEKASEKGEKGDTSTMRVALCNNYAGNSWRQAMLKAWKEAGQEAVSNGILAEVKAFTTAENSVTEQAALMQNLILEGYDAIVINAASPTALNGACKAAHEAGIPVISFDGIVTEPSARLNFDYPSMCYDQMVYVNKRFNGKATVLEIRGLAGTSIDEDIHTGVARGEEEFPGLKVVASVHGNWTQTVAQKAVAGVLPSLPEIDAVVTQGGDGYGCAQAFKAAGRPYPVIMMGNRYVELKWWEEQHDQNGYTTFSNSSTPAVSQTALWTTLLILSGEEVPHDLVPPLLAITQDELDAWLAYTPKGGVASGYFPLDWTKEFIARQKAGKPVPKIPVPE